MKRLFTVVVLLLIACSAFADSGTGVAQFAASLAPPSSDYSVAYLSQIFGTVGDVLQSSSGQMLGQMFDIFNKGVLVSAALYLAFVVVQVTLRASGEGSFMGANKNVFMLMLRITFGFSLLIPSSATGYSLLQDGYMKIVVKGVALADQVWDAALNYIDYGGELYIPPKQFDNDSAIIPKMIGESLSAGTTEIPSPVGPATQIFQDEVCMLKSKEWQEAINKRNSIKTPVQAFHVVYSSASVGYIYFPGAENSNVASNGPDYYRPGSTATNVTHQDPACGYVSDYYINNKTQISNPSAQAIAQMQMYSYGAMEQLVKLLLPVATDFVDNNEISHKDVVAAILAYNNLISPYQKMIDENGAFGDRAGFVAHAEEQGWIMAGSFFWNIERANLKSGSVSASNLTPAASAPLIYKDHIESLGWSSGGAGYALQNSTAVNDFKSDWSNYVGVQQNSAGDQENYLGNTHINPIVALMSEGLHLLNTVIVMWTLGATATLALALSLGFCNSTDPGALVFRAVVTWMKSIVMIISTSLLVPGAILSYYVPFYPFAVFTFAAIGWFLVVIEGMAAAPLVCLGMTHPEGHDFLGKGEQALMLALSVFVRPALLILGFIASMLISFVAFKMMNTAFNHVYQTMESDNQGAIGAGLFLALLTVVYSFIVMELIEQCYKLTFQLPNQIMLWIGGPQTGQDVGQMASAIKGGVSGAASTFGSGVDSTLGKGVDAAIETASKAKKTDTVESK